MKFEDIVDVMPVTNKVEITNSHLFNNYPQYLSLLIQNISMPSLIKMDHEKVQMILKSAKKLSGGIFLKDYSDFNDTESAIITFIVGKDVSLNEVNEEMNKIKELNPHLTTTYGAVISNKIRDSAISFSAIKINGMGGN